jgi:hypothetical protein
VHSRFPTFTHILVGHIVCLRVDVSYTSL